MPKEDTPLRTTRLKDGTMIAFDQAGTGPAVILAGGALSNRAAAVTLIPKLAPHFTVFAFDRRGRGDSGDTSPYAVEREIEDIAALLAEAGGVGISLLVTPQERSSPLRRRAGSRARSPS